MPQENVINKYTTKELQERVKNTIAQIKYITIATVSEDGEPWNAPTFFAYDQHYNIFWGSPAESQHSNNIRANGRASIVIYDSTVTPGTGKGVYIRAVCQELNDVDAAKAAFGRIIQRRGDIPYWQFEEIGSDKPIRMYQATPLHIYTNGGIMKDGIYIDSRVEVVL